MRPIELLVRARRQPDPRQRVGRRRGGVAEKAQRLGRQREPPVAGARPAPETAARGVEAAAGIRTAAALLAGGQRGIDTLQAEHPVLEVARQPGNGNLPRQQRPDRRAKPEQRRIRLRLLRALVENLREVLDVAEPLSVPRQHRRAHRLDVAQPDEIAVLPLVVGEPHRRQRLEAPREPPRARAACAVGHAPLLAPLGRQEHDDAVRFTKVVGAQDQRVGRQDWHRERDRPTL